MTKAVTSPLADAARDAFNSVVDHHVMAKLQLPQLTQNAVLSGDQMTGPPQVGGKQKGTDLGIQ